MLFRSNEQPFDLLIHLGDIEGEEDIIQELAGGETIMVPGNNAITRSVSL